MCSRALVFAVAGALLVASRLAAQRPSDPDPRGSALLARAESLSQWQQQADSGRRREYAERRHGQLLRAGRLQLVLWESVTPEIGQRIATRTDSALEDFGGPMAEWLEHVVGVQANATDAAHVLAMPGTRGRTVVDLDWAYTKDTVSGALNIAGQIARGYRSSLDSVWRTWLPNEFGVVWLSQHESEWALVSLTEPFVSSGAGCLAGRLGECRLWLALDRTARPLATRYRAADLRAEIRRTQFAAAYPDRDACLGGDDAACVRFAESHQVVDPIPSPDIARASLVRATWALHGSRTISRAFADSAGSVGERLARAAGIGEDSLVAEWRAWTLARGRTDRLAATLPQSLAVIFAALLVVFLAARSGRWR
ncbi:MAG: hypothetical protein ACHQX4_09810 [Gemmatimonadales bacterium]